jgi:hypothetical protein
LKTDISAEASIALVRSAVDHFSAARCARRFGIQCRTAKIASATEEVFPTTGGIDAALSDFFGALSDLANNPSDLAARTTHWQSERAWFRLTDTEQLSAIQSNLDQDLWDAHQVGVLTDRSPTLIRKWLSANRRPAG